MINCVVNGRIFYLDLRTQTVSTARRGDLSKEILQGYTSLGFIIGGTL